MVYPNHFLEGEDIANNFLFNADRLVIALLECLVYELTSTLLGFYPSQFMFDCQVHGGNKGEPESLY